MNDTLTKSKQIIDTVTTNMSDTLTTKTTTFATYVAAQATAWSVALADINGLLTSISLCAATVYSIYMIYLKYKDNKKKK